MTNTNGHGPKTAVLYARVSTEEQARSGYSLAQQMEALRTRAVAEGYEVIEEVSDPGQSGASLERPGIDRVRDLVAAGGVSVVLAQDRDRFAREPAYHYLLRREFEEHGTKVRALNNRSDDSPEGELTDGILDQLAKFERAKMTERTRRGRLQKAREGKVMAGRSPRYGFSVNASRDGYEVDEEKMRVVRRIFREVAGGATLRSIKLDLEREGVPTPRGAKFWDRSFFRNCVLDDVYRPHSFEEVAAVVSPEVASRLDTAKSYGLWWFNRRSMKSRQVSEVSEGERRYARKYSSHIKPKEEWIAVPVPDSGVARELVDSARAAIEGNRVPSSAGDRFWQLSGGVARCGACGRRMRVLNRIKRRKNGSRRYGYYRCAARHDNGEESCSNGRMVSATVLEAKVWAFVRGALTEPEKLAKDLDRMIELKRSERSGDPQKEANVWIDELAKLERMRDGYHDQAAEGLLGFDKLREKLAALDERRVTAERELEALKGRREELERLKRDRDAVVSHYAALAPEVLESLGPEERHRLYGILGLRVFVEDGDAWAEMPIRPPTPLREDGVYRKEVTSTSARTGGPSSSAWPSRTFCASSGVSRALSPLRPSAPALGRLLLPSLARFGRQASWPTSQEERPQTKAVGSSWPTAKS
jgi:site-specific DNA recombinase